MCQNRTDSQKPLSGACANVQGQATAQLQLSNQSPVMCHLVSSVMGNLHERQYDTNRPYTTDNGTATCRCNVMTFAPAHFGKRPVTPFSEIATTFPPREKQCRKHAQSSDRIEKASQKG